ncbi:GNAT family N-acetyltransferase [Rubripirellula amarantea]|nr:GNAT family N-acetyltransferase [Rubripirellula amarantea]
MQIRKTGWIENKASVLTQNQANYRVESTPIELLPEKLPVWLQGISIGRAQIIVDQLRSVISDRKEDPKSQPAVIWLTATPTQTKPGDETFDPVVPVSIIAVQGRVTSQEHADTVTVIHGGPMGPSDNGAPTDDGVSINNDVSSEAFVELTEAFDEQMRNRGVKFAQWATDPDPSQEATLQFECFGFAKLATLQYMSGQFPRTHGQLETDRKRNNNARLKPSPVSLRAINVDDAKSLERFVNIVEQTYVDTLDCPQLNQFRSAAQTISGYQTSTAYDPSRWFEIVDADDSAIGAVILATHSEKASELVYMALIPSARGKGLGHEVMQRVIEEIQIRLSPSEQNITIPQLVLAVDEKNVPAKRIYEAAGLKPMIRECVWGKHFTDQAMR